jgi:putative peptide zinc metalloprotease protein
VVLVTFAVWWVTGWNAVLLVIAGQVLQMIRQLAPLLRFDGYHVLADLTGVPDLYQRIGPVMSGLLPGRWRQPEATALKTWARVVVVAWVLLVVPLMAVSLLLLVLALPRLLATAWQSLGRQAGLLADSFADGDVLGVLARLLAIVALAVPVLGIGYVLARTVRQVARGVWRRTEGRPVPRALAVLLAAALVAGLSWAWWPADDRYRPVRAWEGGTLLDAVPAASSTGLAAGSRGAAATVWPADAGPLPTEDDPVLAMVLVPASSGVGEGDEAIAGTGSDDDGGPAPTWVFPFDRPLPPGEGDNQALAVNTEDGSVRYDVSFALVWADEDAAVNRNEAYALASCRDCTTVAVAFQVVLFVGSVDVVPENIAAAVNYACVECVTHALATQLVVSLPGPLSDDGTRQLTAIWAELQKFGRQIEGLPLGELRTRLTEFEQRILAVVRVDTAVGDGDRPTGTAPATGYTEPVSTAGPTRTGGAIPTATGTGPTSAPSTSTADPSPSTDAAATGSTTEESEPIATTSPASGSAASTASPRTTG